MRQRLILIIELLLAPLAGVIIGFIYYLVMFRFSSWGDDTPYIIPVSVLGTALVCVLAATQHFRLRAAKRRVRELENAVATGQPQPAE